MKKIIMLFAVGLSIGSGYSQTKRWSITEKKVAVLDCKFQGLIREGETDTVKYIYLGFQK